MIFLTPQQALDAMIEFLYQYYYKPIKSDDIGSLLGDISPSIIWPRNTRDPSAWIDWIKAIDEVSKYSKEPKIDDKLTPKLTFLAMREFLYSVYGRFDDVTVVLYDTRFNADREIINKEVWINFMKTIEIVLKKHESENK